MATKCERYTVWRKKRHELSHALRRRDMNRQFVPTPLSFDAILPFPITLTLTLNPTPRKWKTAKWEVTLHTSVNSGNIETECVLTVTESEREFRQLLRRGWGTRLRPWTTFVHIKKFDSSGNGDIGDVHWLGDCSSDQSRLSTRTSSCRHWLGYWQTKTADLRRPIKVSWQ